MTPKANKIRVFFVDDQTMFRLSIESFLNESGLVEVVGTAVDGHEAVNKIGEIHNEIDIVLMDIRMPVMNGIEALSVIAKKYPQLKTIMLTMFDDESYITQALFNGARAYVLKDAHPEELLQTIQQVQTYGCHITPPLLSILTHFGPRSFRKYRSKDLELSERERQVLKFISNEFSIQEIAEKLNLSARTIEGCRVDLMKKIGAKNSVGLAIYAMKEGVV